MFFKKFFSHKHVWNAHLHAIGPYDLYVSHCPKCDCFSIDGSLRIYSRAEFFNIINKLNKNK